MAEEPTKTNPNGLPEKIGVAFGFIVIVVGWPHGLPASCN